MRTTHAVRNIASSILFGGLVVLVQFMLQWALAKALGAEYLGLNSLFVATIALLAVAELGFGSAVVYHLYKPLKHQDWARVGVLMRFYRKIYRAVAAAVLVLGALLLPLLSLIVGDHQLDSNIYIVFVLFLLNAVVSYLLSYKRSLLQADQRGYVIDIIYSATYLVIGIMQVLVLFMTHSYYLFLLGNLLLTIISCIIINHKALKRYPYVNLSDSQTIDVATKAHMFKQVKGLIYHKTASFIVPSSSNIIISMLLGLKSVGLASNYLLVSGAITMMTWKISGAITAGVGNLLVDADEGKTYKVYRTLLLGSALLSASVAVVYLVCINRFVMLWVGAEYVLGLGVVVALVCKIYLEVMRIVPNGFKQAAGVFYEDRYMPITEAAINVVASLVGALLFGLEGVFWGLVLSTLFLHLFAYPKYVYSGILQLQPTRYIIDSIPYLLATILSAVLAWIAASFIVIDGLFGLIVVSLTAISVVLVVFYLMFSKSSEWTYYTELTRGVVVKVRTKLLS